jgi:hypothetical protein
MVPLDERMNELDKLRVESDSIKKAISDTNGGLLEKPRLVYQTTGKSVADFVGDTDDTSLLLANMRSIAAAGESAQKFKSRERIELERLRARQQYKSTKIRILFSDKTALELVVSVGETISGLYQILCNCMNEGMKKSQEWYLTVSPPMRRLDRKSRNTMLSEEFVPSVVMRLMMNGSQCTSGQVLNSDFSIT